MQLVSELARGPETINFKSILVGNKSLPGIDKAIHTLIIINIYGCTRVASLGMRESESVRLTERSEG